MIVIFEGGPVNGLFRTVLNGKNELRVRTAPESDSQEAQVAVYLLKEKHRIPNVRKWAASFVFAGYRESASSLIDFVVPTGAAPPRE